ncbi:glycosyl hydrolase family 28-related protein [Metabacillus sp. 113a]|uniref:right-handed parallel beta-helix repeat-containing protein n=1 Tax=Metabacillus sp. 113a TaxID=3404706 RepID=UPI003CF75698
MKKKAGLIIISAAILTLIVLVMQKDDEKKTDILNVKEYGAAGDGKKDDTKPIQEALKDGAHKRVYFPKGTYKVSKDLLVSSHTEVYGDHAGIFPSSGMESVMRIKGSSVHIHDLTIDGKEKSLRGITVEPGSSRVHVSKGILKNFNQPNGPELSQQTVSAFRVEGGTSDITLDQSRISNAAARNPIKGWNHKVARGVLISPGSDDQPPARNITISNSTITSIGPKDDGDGIVVQGFKERVGLIISGNTFTNVHKRAIKIQSPGAVIKKNIIYNSFRKNNHYTTYYDPHKYDMWAAISVYADHTVIQQNSISGSGDYGRIIDVANASHVKIDANYIQNGHRANYRDSSVVSITSDKPRTGANITVSNNTLANGRYGIFAEKKIKGIEVLNNHPINVADYQNKALKETLRES